MYGVYRQPPAIRLPATRLLPESPPMANLDTTSKRRSSVQILSPYILAPLLPDSTIGQGDRQHIAWSYSGILSAGTITGTVACSLGEFVSAAEGTHSGVGGGVDTAQKRQSSVMMMVTSRLAPKFPDGSLDQADRQHGAFTYSGILAGGSVSGTVAVSFGEFVSTVTGAHGVSGSSAITIADFVSSSAGAHGVSVSGTPTLGEFVSSASAAFGSDGVTGTGESLIGDFVSSATATHSGTVTGTCAQSIDEFVSSSAAAHGVSASAAAIISNFTSSASGMFGANPTPENRTLVWLAENRTLVWPG